MNTINLQYEAKRIINELGLLKLIESTFPNYIFIGSYANQTMVWPDIDICISLSQNAKTDFNRLVYEILNLDNIYKLVYKNEFMEINESKSAYYIGVHYYDKRRDIRWKIDIKGVEEGKFESIKVSQKQLENLRLDQKELIIEAKKRILSEIDGFYRPEKSKSHAIQELVLSNQCENINEIMRCLGNESFN